MENNYAERSISLTRYLFESPDWPISIALSLAFSIIVGAAAFHTSPQLNGIIEGMIIGFSVIGAPAVFSALTTTWFIRRISGKMNLNRSALLSLFSAIIVGVGTVIGALIELIGPDFIYDSFMMFLGIIFAIRVLVLLSLSKRTLIGTLPPASLQPLASVVLVYFFNKTISLYLEFLMTSIIFITAFYLLVIYLDRPLRRAFNISGLDFLRGFVNYSGDEKEEIESLFNEIGEFVKAPVGIISFKNEDGVKAVLVSPSIHPGPVGELGGGDLPKALAHDIETKHDCMALIGHGAATHDFNLVNSGESKKISKKVLESLEEMEYGEAAYPVREQVGDVKILAQKLDKGVLATSTLSPEPTEDIAFPIGYSIMLNSKVKGQGDLVFLDAHNCTWKQPTGIYPGSQHSFDIIEAAEKATEKAGKEELMKLKLGIAKKKVKWSWEEGFGSLGIRIAYMELGNQKIAYVFLDGNNLKKGLREKILKNLPIDDGEVMTTDNHVVNLRGENPIGSRIDNQELIKEIKELFKEAKDDLEEVEVGAKTKMVEDLEVFGSNMAAQLASTANAIIAMGGALASASILAAFAFSIIAFLLT